MGSNARGGLPLTQQLKESSLRDHRSKARGRGRRASVHVRRGEGGGSAGNIKQGPGSSPTIRHCMMQLGSRRGKHFGVRFRGSKLGRRSGFVGTVLFKRRVGIIGVSGTAVSCCVHLAGFCRRFRNVNGGCGRAIGTIGAGFKRGQTCTLLQGLRGTAVSLMILDGQVVVLARRFRRTCLVGEGERRK